MTLQSIAGLLLPVAVCCLILCVKRIARASRYDVWPPRGKGGRRGGAC